LDGPATRLAVDLSDLSIRFGDLVAVSKVSLPIRQGEFVSIVGPSGCGKTTILNLIAGLLPTSVASGAFLVNGKLPSSGNRDISYMLARDALCPWRTTLANAELGCEIRGVPAAERRAIARDLLNKVGLSDFESAYPKALSQGMRQRTALARTFAMDAPILLMDEPFGALDAQTKLQLEDVLLSLWQSTHRTVVFITHDLSEAVSMSDRVIVLSARPGRIAADVEVNLGRPRSVRALQKEPAYHALYADIWTRLEQGIPA
jgi:NitT/TauT family transport system ATP-binding protein